MKLFSRSIRLFWWSEPLLMKKPLENYGDFVGAYLVDKISGKDVIFAHPKKHNWRDIFQPIYVSAGSILAHVNRKCIVWGSGVIKEDEQVKNAKFLAVRGPETRRVLMQQGYDVPEIFGDPALLLSRFYKPKIDKKFKIGIVPHYVDYEGVKELFRDNLEIKVINLMTKDVEKTTNEILQCEKIVSSSLHGLIVSHAYQIPAVWLRFSDRLFGDNIKFTDYFKSVDIESYSADIITDYLTRDYLENLFNLYPFLPNYQKIEKIQEELLKVCPFLH